MAVRQYIGARYVPRFRGTYDVTQIYDALDVVDNGSGTSYIARKTVPAGTPLTDSEYWFVYGASSGAIYDLQNRMGTAENDITALDARLDRIELGEVIAVSDSYGHYPSTSDNWIDRLALMIPNTVYKAELSGAAFGDNTKSFTDAIELVENTVPDPSKVSTIVLCGGRNDYAFTDAEIDAGMSDFSDYITNHYPNAKAYIFFVGIDKDMSKEDDLQERIQPRYAQYASKYVNMCYVQGSELILRNYAFLVDSTHPDASGAACIARGVKNWLYTGSAMINQHLLTTGTLSHSGSSQVYGDVTVRGCQIGDIIRLNSDSLITVTFSTNQDFTSPVEIGTLDFPYIIGTSRFRVTVAIGFRMPDVEAYYQNGAGVLTIENGKVYLTFQHPHGVDSVRFRLLNFDVPTMFC